VIFDLQKITYSEILDVFWRHIDPTDAGGQFADRVACTKAPFFITMKNRKGLPFNQGRG
jgi:peptide methionine sulfoxide reductase msrA/msrB